MTVALLILSDDCSKAPSQLFHVQGVLCNLDDCWSKYSLYQPPPGYEGVNARYSFCEVCNGIILISLQQTCCLNISHLSQSKLTMSQSHRARDKAMAPSVTAAQSIKEQSHKVGQFGRLDLAACNAVVKHWQHTELQMLPPN